MLESFLDYLGAIGFWWWTGFIAFAGAMSVVRLFHKFSRWWYLCVAVAFLFLAPFSAWKDMRDQRDALIEAGPDLEVRVRSHNRNSRSLDIFVRNDGDTTSVVEQFYICDTRDWWLQRDAEEQADTQPKEIHAPEWSPEYVKTEEYRVLMAAMFESDSTLKLVCDAKQAERLRIEVRKGRRSIQPGEVSEFRLHGIPSYWSINQGIYGRGYSDVCPLQLDADNARTLLAMPCLIDSEEDD